MFPQNLVAVPLPCDCDEPQILSIPEESGVDSESLDIAVGPSKLRWELSTSVRDDGRTFGNVSNVVGPVSNEAEPRHLDSTSLSVTALAAPVLPLKPPVPHPTGTLTLSSIGRSS